jgi:hypothetical protein
MDNIIEKVIIIDGRNRSRCRFGAARGDWAWRAVEIEGSVARVMKGVAML